jgi:hypothetical protein
MPPREDWGLSPKKPSLSRDGFDIGSWIVGSPRVFLAFNIYSIILSLKMDWVRIN